MPGFYEKMKNRLRTPEQGADTLVWLSISKNVNKEKSGQFWQGKMEYFYQDLLCTSSDVTFVNIHNNVKTRIFVFDLQIEKLLTFTFR